MCSTHTGVAARLRFRWVQEAVRVLQSAIAQQRSEAQALRWGAGGLAWQACAHDERTQSCMLAGSRAAAHPASQIMKELSAQVGISEFSNCKTWYENAQVCGLVQLSLPCAETTVC